MENEAAAGQLRRLRDVAIERAAAEGVTVRIPPLSLCTDNGAMIAALASELIMSGRPASTLEFGADSTLPVTLEDMIYHGRAVRRAVRRALVVVDMPFLSFQISPAETLRNAGRILKETGAEAVKLEGGDEETAEQRLDDALP